MRRAADAVLGPPQRVLGAGARSVGNALGDLPRVGKLGDENRRLREENDELRAQLRAADDLRRIRDETRALLRLKDLGTFTIVPARLASVGSVMGFERTATIDAGSKDGLRPDMTVVSGRGLVGRTTRVGPYTSTVLLLTDPGFVVGARLSRSAALGTVEGTGGSRLEYQLFDQMERLEKGDVLFTTGSGTFPPGIPVGRITQVRSAQALTRSAEVEPFVDVGQLDVLGVITDGPRSTPRIPVPPS